MMTTEATPGALGSNDGLGLAPEPYLSAKVTTSLLGPNVIEPLFTARQLLTAIAADRERIAAWLEVQRNDIPATGAEFAAALRSHRA
jgi:hypothetical protein